MINKLMNNYYTYAYLREDGTPYYIGKGKGKRAWDKRHRVHLPTDMSRIQIIKDHLTNDEAKTLEIELIAKYGRKDLGTGILYNQTDGGDGASLAGKKNGMYGKAHSSEAREKIKEARSRQVIIRTEEQRKAQSDRLKGRARPPRKDGLPDHHTEETRAKIAAAHLGKPKKKGYIQSEEQKKKKLESFRATLAAKKALAPNNI
jgi:hypothetical protein